MGPIQFMFLKLVLSFVVMAATILFIADITAEIDSDELAPLMCDLSPSLPTLAANSSDLDAAFRDLIAMNYLAVGDRILCLGPESSAATDASNRLGISAAVRSSADPCCGLPFFAADSFEFALATSLDRVRVPARILLEMERVIRPGRFGAVLSIRSGSVKPDELMKAAAPIVSLLRFSDVIGARAVNGSAMVIFKKRGPPTNRKIGGHSIKCNEGIPKLPLLLTGIIRLLRSAVLVGGGRFGHFDLT